jgi:two-component system, chemotaxis family, chemotaxis protein CheY
MESDVLVVDDSAAIRKILQRVLRQTGMAIRNIITKLATGRKRSRF